jgi:glycosyltransferase involved in cell wall biosynthesis
VAEARARLGIGDHELVVGAVGTADWRKGADLFLQVAARVRRVAPELAVRFLWVGRSLPHDAVHHRVDVAGLGLGGTVSFVGEVADPGTYLSLMDVFCLTSREDPYPLVCLEAATLGVPVVTFANGGMVELAAADGPEPLLGCVPYLDVEAMADAVVERLVRPDRGAREGARLRAWVLDHHLSAVGARDIGVVLDGLRAEWEAEDGRPEDGTASPGVPGADRTGGEGRAAAAAPGPA